MGFYEKLFRGVLFPAYETHVRGRPTLRHLDEFERSQWLSADELQALQWRRLVGLLEHCWREVPYYRQQWKRLGATPAEALAAYQRALVLRAALMLPAIRNARARAHAFVLVADGADAAIAAEMAPPAP